MQHVSGIGRRLRQAIRYGEQLLGIFLVQQLQCSAITAPRLACQAPLLSQADHAIPSSTATPFASGSSTIGACFNPVLDIPIDRTAFSMRNRAGASSSCRG